VTAVDEPVQERLGDDRVGEQRIPIGRRPVAGQHERLPGTVGDQLLEVVCLRRGELAHPEIVESQDGGTAQLPEPLVPAAVGTSAGEVGEGAAGLVESGVRPGPDRKVGQGLGDVAIADADRA
jgi:hypothetical protein